MPSLSSAVPRWFTKIESVLGLERSSSYARTIVLQPLLHPAVPNPFRSSLLPFAPIAARVGDFVVVFPTSFPDDGNYFLAQLVGWEDSTSDGIVSYHLQHWHDANEYDDPGVCSWRVATLCSVVEIVRLLSLVSHVEQAVVGGRLQELSKCHMIPGQVGFIE